MILLLYLVVAGTRSQSWYNDCSVGRTQDMRSSALLYAHRCYLRDVPIAVPTPDNVIPDQILPSHIVVPRCQGKTSTFLLQYNNTFISRIVSGKPGVLLPAKEDQVREVRDHGVREQHSVLHEYRAGAPPGSLQM